jgi:hypothetical protein
MVSFVTFRSTDQHVDDCWHSRSYEATEDNEISFAEGDEIIQIEEVSEDL